MLIFSLGVRLGCVGIDNTLVEDDFVSVDFFDCFKRFCTVVLFTLLLVVPKFSSKLGKFQILTNR